MREVGLPLLCERCHAFLLILSSEELLEEATFETETLGKGEFVGCVHREVGGNRKLRRGEREPTSHSGESREAESVMVE